MYTINSATLLVPVGSHIEVCDLAEERIAEGTLTNPNSRTTEEVRYKAADRILSILREPKDILEDAGPTTDTSSLRVVTYRVLPSSDPWLPDAGTDEHTYVCEEFEAGNLEAGAVMVPWKYGIEIEHLASNGVPVIDGDLSALHERTNPYDESTFEKGGEYSETYQKLHLERLNVACEHFPGIMDDYVQGQFSVERLLRVQILLGSSTLEDIGPDLFPKE